MYIPYGHFTTIETRKWSSDTQSEKQSTSVTDVVRTRSRLYQKRPAGGEPLPPPAGRFSYQGMESGNCAAAAGVGGNGVNLW